MINEDGPKTFFVRPKETSLPKRDIDKQPLILCIREEEYILSKTNLAINRPKKDRSERRSKQNKRLLKAIEPKVFSKKEFVLCLLEYYL